MTRAREAARLIGNNTFRLDSNNAVGFNSTTPDAMFDINRGLTVAGVSTFTGNVTMSGDLTVQGTTTTLDTVVQEVDLMNIQANTSTPGLGVTQSGSGKIIAAYDSTTEVFSVADGGTTTVDADLSLRGASYNASWDKSANSLKFADNAKIQLGSGEDLEIFHDGSNSYISDVGVGNLYITSTDGNINIQTNASENAVKCIENGAVELYHDASKKLETKSDGIDVTGEVQCDSLDVDGAADISGAVTLHANLDLQDSDRIRLGTGDDLQIYHDGTDSFIDNSAADLILRSTGDDVIIRAADDVIIQTQSSENAIVCNNNGNVELYHNAVKKLETTGDGITVTGDVNSTSDINLKKDIEVVTSATEMLNQLRGVKFTWKENDEKSVGVIAQEVEAILPELVKGEEGDKSVNYSGLIGVLIEAVKELSARVEELENK